MGSRRQQLAHQKSTAHGERQAHSVTQDARLRRQFTTDRRNVIAGALHEGFQVDAADDRCTHARIGLGMTQAVDMCEQYFELVGRGLDDALVQAIAGLGTDTAPTERRIDRDLAREAIAARWEAELENRFEVGGLREALIRALIHIRLPEGSVDERSFAMLQALRQLQPGNRRPSMAEVKTLFRDQYMLVRLDEERAVRAIPHLLPESEEARRAGIEALLQVLGARGNLPEEGLRRLRRVEELFGYASRESPAGEASHA